MMTALKTATLKTLTVKTKVLSWPNKTALIALACFTLISGSALAQTLYVVDELKINFRSGPTNSHRIIKLLPSGTALTFIQSDETGEWSQVRTADGEEGWVLTQYVDAKPVARLLLAEAQRQLAQTSGSRQNLSSENTELKQQNASLQEQLTTAQQQAEQSRTELEEIRRVASGSIELNARHQQLLQENQSLQTELDVANAKIDRLSDDSKQTWFLYGAIAVAIGVILTLIVQNVRSRRRYSEWA